MAISPSFDRQNAPAGFLVPVKASLCGRKAHAADQGSSFIQQGL
jgi:hypothetical protein